MRRLISILLITVFTLWLLPLGIFIALSKEKLLCDGQRAVCMCSHASAKDKKVEGKGITLVKAASSAQKESSSSAGNYFLASIDQDTHQILSLTFFSRHKDFYSLVVRKPVDHVPKA